MLKVFVLVNIANRAHICRLKEIATSPMTRDELKDLACLGFSSISGCNHYSRHTAAYPKPVDVTTHHTLPDFIMNRGGISLRPKRWRCASTLVKPDVVTRIPWEPAVILILFPVWISFPAGSGLVAFAALTGVMPLICRNRY